MSTSTEKLLAEIDRHEQEDAAAARRAELSRPIGPELMAAETNALRRLSPRRNRWPELVELDQRVGELEKRHAAANERLRDVRAQLANAPVLDADRRAGWELAGRKGAEPVSPVPGLEESAGKLEAEAAGLLSAVDRVLEQRAAFVERHRERLATDAERAAKEKHAELVARIAEVEQAREELTELREAELWARCYGSKAATTDPQWRLFAGGLAAPAQEMLGGVSVQIEYRRLLEGLRHDGAWVLRAATAEQRAELEGRDPRTPPGTVWDDTDEGKQQRRAESEAYRRRHRERFGTEAPW